MALTLVNNLLYTFLLTTSLSNALCSLLKSTEIVFGLTISTSLTSNFKLAKSAFLANSDISTLVDFLKSSFAAKYFYFAKSNSTSVIFLLWLYGSGK